MVATRSSHATQDPEDNPFGKDPLSTIASRLEAIDMLSEKVAALEARYSRGKGAHRYRAGESDDESEIQTRNLRMPYTKIEFPKFSGGDPRGWILKAEKYFRYYETPEDDKVDIASMYLEGDALDLFSWIMGQRTVVFWEELVKALQEQYGPPEYQNPDEYWCSIKQTGSVHEYRSEFAKRQAHVRNWPDHCLLGVFINGLKEELKSDVRIHKPRSVFRATSLALEYESKLKIASKPKPASSFTTQTQTNYFTRDPKGSTHTTSHAIASSSGTKSLTTPPTSDYQYRRDKGLCFRCGETFRPGHRCASLFSLMELIEEGEEVIPPVGENVSAEEEEATAEISFNAIMGKASASTMKLEGKL